MKATTVKSFFGFAFSASMIPAGDVQLKKRDLTVEEVREMLPNCELCLNPSHKATITAARERFDLSLEVPEKPARISLNEGDSVVIMQVRGLPRLTDRHEYTEQEIAKATFSFSEITVVNARRPGDCVADGNNRGILSVDREEKLGECPFCGQKWDYCLPYVEGRVLLQYYVEAGEDWERTYEKFWAIQPKGFVIHGAGMTTSPDEVFLAIPEGSKLPEMPRKISRGVRDGSPVPSDFEEGSVNRELCMRDFGKLPLTELPKGTLWIAPIPQEHGTPPACNWEPISQLQETSSKEVFWESPFEEN